MINFEYCNPTKVYFGKETEKQVGKICKKLGYKKILIIYGGKSAIKSGLIESIEKSLDKEQIKNFKVGGVVPNPRVSKVREILHIAREQQVDFLLAVGGGSVIDTAKATAMAYVNECDPWQIYNREVFIDKAIPVGAVLTIAASGSETSDASIITDDATGLKRGYSHECIRPIFAIMNPELTFSLPAYHTEAGIVDIMMHTMERYFTCTSHVELTDRMSEALLITVMENARILMKNPMDYDARAEIMWAGSISHNGLMGTGKEKDFSAHQIEHELGGMFDVIHGAGLAAIWSSWARYIYKKHINIFAQFAVRVMKVEMNYEYPEKTALRGIEKIEEFFKSIHMPISINELGISSLTEEQIEQLATQCTYFGKRKIGVIEVLDKKDIKQIYRMACII